MSVDEVSSKPAPEANDQDDNANDQDDNAGNRKNKKIILIKKIILGVLIVVVLCGLGILGYHKYEVYKLTHTPEGQEIVDNPKNFERLQAKNSNIIGWLYVPQTKVNYAIMQHATNDKYYMTHNDSDAFSFAGQPFIQLANSADFTDPVTVVYGHNNLDETMFNTLHYFEDTEFFAANDTFFIYIPGHVLRYRIVSAYIGDAKHIINSYDWDDTDVVKSYFDFVINPKSLVSNVRDGASLAATDRIVQLSTCVNSSATTTQRFLVTGVLVYDQATY